MSIRELLALPTAGLPLDVTTFDTRATPGFDGDKAQARQEVADLGPRLAELQERLYAEGKAGGRRRVVLVLQAMDSGGKDGAVKHVVGLVNPAGVKITAFGPPTEDERGHDFLWRVENAVPEPGYLGVFNRSHYEDVLIVRVHDLVPQAEWEQRYDQINAWEARLAGEGVVFVKVFLHISRDEQRERLLARLDDPTKHWKVNPGDLTERQSWDAYQQAFSVALQRCSTDVAPWHLVPADRKWYRDWALTHLLVEVLEGMDPQWPTPEGLDLDAMRGQLTED
ncbi:MAG: UDP-galactose-lipid carrier transferase [Frankiales bacterium]|nr:UDP-galactose-lipid carrier transferase [Frankiales bacterium]